VLEEKKILAKLFIFIQYTWAQEGGDIRLGHESTIHVYEQGGQWTASQVLMLGHGLA
jgi:hypothetical protein